MNWKRKGIENKKGNRKNRKRKQCEPPLSQIPTTFYNIFLSQHQTPYGVVFVFSKNSYCSSNLNQTLKTSRKHRRREWKKYFLKRFFFLVPSGKMNFKKIKRFWTPQSFPSNRRVAPRNHKSIFNEPKTHKKFPNFS